MYCLSKIHLIPTLLSSGMQAIVTRDLSREFKTFLHDGLVKNSFETVFHTVDVESTTFNRKFFYSSNLLRQSLSHLSTGEDADTFKNRVVVLANHVKTGTLSATNYSNHGCHVNRSC